MSENSKPSTMHRKGDLQVHQINGLKTDRLDISKIRHLRNAQSALT